MCLDIIKKVLGQRSGTFPARRSGAFRHLFSSKKALMISGGATVFKVGGSFFAKNFFPKKIFSGPPPPLFVRTPPPLLGGPSEMWGGPEVFLSQNHAFCA